jgi:hypothetical protein
MILPSSKQRSAPPERAHRVAPHFHRVFSNLKSWLNGTHHGVNPWYLQRYLDEFDFLLQPAQHDNACLPDPAGDNYPESALSAGVSTRF